MAKRFQRIGTVAVRLLAGGMIAAVCGLPVMATGQAQEPTVSQRRPPIGPGEAILLRSTLIAINQANVTSDYSVLHAMIEPERAKALTGERLAEIFKPWRDRSRDFGFVAIADAELGQPTATDAEGRLQLAGIVPTPSFKLAFDLTFVQIGGRWMLARFVLGDGGLSATSELPPAASAPAPAAATQTAATGGSPAIARPTPPLPPARPGP